MTAAGAPNEKVGLGCSFGAAVAVVVTGIVNRLLVVAVLVDEGGIEKSELVAVVPMAVVAGKLNSVLLVAAVVDGGTANGVATGPVMAELVGKVCAANTPVFGGSLGVISLVVVSGSANDTAFLAESLRVSATVKPSTGAALVESAATTSDVLKPNFTKICYFMNIITEVCF